LISMSNRDHARIRLGAALSGIAFACLILFSVMILAKADDDFVSAKDPGVFIDKLGEAAIHSLTAPISTPTIGASASGTCCRNRST
jgi:hypothetical protein